MAGSELVDQLHAALGSFAEPGEHGRDHQAARSVGIPVVGVGGIASAEDGLEFLVAGCAAVQVGTATFSDPIAIAKVHDGIASFLERRKLSSLAELPRYLSRD